MFLKATEYTVGPVWSYARVKNFIQDSLPVETVLKHFLSVFLAKEHFKKIVIWNNRFLRNRRSFGLSKKELYRLIVSLKEAKERERAILKSCFSHGHMSVLFTPKRADYFLDCLMRTEYYGTGKHIYVGQGGSDDPLDSLAWEGLRVLIKDTLDTEESIFAFSHDCQQMYVIATADGTGGY